MSHFCRKQPSVLLIVTGHGELGNTGKRTGLHLEELALPYEEFRHAGFHADVASPTGGDAPIDPRSLCDDLLPYVPLTKGTLPLHQITPGDHDVYFIVGGHGTMWDLPADPSLQRLLIAAFKQNKIVAAVCHGPAALVHLRDEDGSYLIGGKRVTGFTNAEEAAAGLTEVMPFLLEDALKRAGGIFIGKANRQLNVVVDGRLITAQNRPSARRASGVIIDVLEAPQ
jgi:putative intracellular protease/amidase